PAQVVVQGGEATAELVRTKLAATTWGAPDGDLKPVDAATCARAAKEAKELGAAGWVYYAGFADTRGCTIAVADARAALATIAADDPRWALLDVAITGTLKALRGPDPAVVDAYAAEVVARHANKFLVADVLLAQLTAAGSDKAKARPIYKLLRSD